MPYTPERYDAAFKAARRMWKQRIANGWEPTCTRCPGIITANDPWDLDHYDEGNARVYLPAHLICNRRAGGKKAQANRRARAAQPSRPASQTW